VVVTNHGSTKKKGQVYDFCGRLQKTKCNHQKRFICIVFIVEVLINTIARHDANSFQNGYFGYHQISITPKDTYKITFLIDWGALTLLVMPFGV